MTGSAALRRNWDINDAALPVYPPDAFQHWPDNHCAFFYAVDSSLAQKHASGWAMRNTNNHNGKVLKKSCVGVMVCSRSCTLPCGGRVYARPAICDKARRKQIGRACPNEACIGGRLDNLVCQGHGGYPVTHFWRHTDVGVYFQTKGVHNHPRPESKAPAAVRSKSRRRDVSESPGHDRGRKRTPGVDETANCEKSCKIPRLGELMPYVAPPSNERPPMGFHGQTRNTLQIAVPATSGGYSGNSALACNYSQDGQYLSQQSPVQGYQLASQRYAGYSQLGAYQTPYKGHSKSCTFTGGATSNPGDPAPPYGTVPTADPVRMQISPPQTDSGTCDYSSADFCSGNASSLAYSAEIPSDTTQDYIADVSDHRHHLSLEQQPNKFNSSNINSSSMIQEYATSNQRQLSPEQHSKQFTTSSNARYTTQGHIMDSSSHPHLYSEQHCEKFTNRSSTNGCASRLSPVQHLKTTTTTRSIVVTQEYMAELPVSPASCADQQVPSYGATSPESTCCTDLQPMSVLNGGATCLTREDLAFEIPELGVVDVTKDFQFDKSFLTSFYSDVASH